MLGNNRRTRSLPTIKEYDNSVQREVTSRYENDFVEISKIGKGGYGAVYKVVNRLDGIQYAMKKIERWESANTTIISPPPTSSVYMNKNLRQWRILREVRSLASLDHPNICRYFAAWIEEKPEKGFPTDQQRNDTKAQIDRNHDKRDDREDMSIEFERDVHKTQVSAEHTESFRPEKDIGPSEKGTLTLYIQMQLYEKTLRDWLDCPKHHLNKHPNLDLFKQIAEGLEYVHLQGIIHRDLKPENIFLAQSSKGMVIRIGDFGLATTTCELEQEVTNPEDCPSAHTSGVGTMTYASPEQQKCQKYNEKTDIYSLGIILFELLTYFPTKMERAVVLRDLRQYILPPFFLRDYPHESAFILRLMCPTPESRPSASEILESNLIADLQPFVMTPRKELEALKMKIKQQEEIIRKQEALLQVSILQEQNVNHLHLSPRRQVKRRLWMGAMDKENQRNDECSSPRSPKKLNPLFM